MTDADQAAATAIVPGSRGRRPAFEGVRMTNRFVEFVDEDGDLVRVGVAVGEWPVGGEQSLTQGARRKAQETRWETLRSSMRSLREALRAEWPWRICRLQNTLQEIGLRFVYPMAQHLG